MRRDVFQAIADPTRREIIGLIAHQSLTPNVLAESFPMSRQAISKHIRILTESGLLTLDIQGREHYYSIQPKKLAEVQTWIEQFRDLWEQRFNQLDELLMKDRTGDSRVTRSRQKTNKINNPKKNNH